MGLGYCSYVRSFSRVEIWVGSNNSLSLVWFIQNKKERKKIRVLNRSRRFSFSLFTQTLSQRKENESNRIDRRKEMETGGDEGLIERVVDSKDLQQQSKAFDKLTDRVEDRQLDSTRVQEVLSLSLSLSLFAFLTLIELCLCFLFVLVSYGCDWWRGRLWPLLLPHLKRIGMLWKWGAYKQLELIFKTLSICR